MTLQAHQKWYHCSAVISTIVHFYSSISNLVQIQLSVCQKFEVVRTSDNGSSWKQGLMFVFCKATSQNLSIIKIIMAFFVQKNTFKQNSTLSTYLIGHMKKQLLYNIVNQCHESNMHKIVTVLR